MRSICLSERKTVRLAQTDGSLIPYNGVKLPKLLEAPLIIDDNENGYATGFNSGMRSAVVEVEKTYYKLKGCNPEGGKYDTEPFGGMSRKKCLNELKSNEKISDKYSEYGLFAPLHPLGMFEYKKEFNGDNICCAIMQCTGDTRLSEAEGKLLSLHKRHPEKWNYEYLDKLSSGVAMLLGLNHRILEKAGVAPAENSFDFDNYVLHQANKKGCGVARVDLASALHGAETKELLEKKKQFDKKELTELPRTFCVAEVARKFGIPFKSVWRGYSDKKQISFVEESEGREWKEEDEKNITLHVRSGRFDWVKKIESTYLKFAEGTEVPEPIEMEIIYPLFS